MNQNLMLLYVWYNAQNCFGIPLFAGGYQGSRKDIPAHCKAQIFLELSQPCLIFLNVVKIILVFILRYVINYCVLSDGIFLYGRQN